MHFPSPICRHKFGPSYGGEEIASAATQSRRPSPSHTLNPINTPTSNAAVAGDDFIYPAHQARQGSVVRNLAFKQLFAARNLLHHPGEVLQREIAEAADNLLGITIKLSEGELETLTKYIVSPTGVLAGKSPKILIEILERLREGTRLGVGSAGAIDRAAFISILRDIGCLYADASKHKNNGLLSLSSEQKQALLGRMSNLIAQANLSPLSDEILKRVAKASAGTGVVGPMKQVERKKADAPLPRRGLYDLGDEVDDSLGVPAQMRIPSVFLAPMRIKAVRVLNNLEPFVAHMSGCPGERLMVWDMLRGERADQIYTGALDVHRNAMNAGLDRVGPLDRFGPEERKARLARVAGACAMLIGVGYHSAVEVAEGALKYTGQDIRSVLDNAATQDAAHLLGAGAATDLIVELFEAQTKSDPPCPPNFDPGWKPMHRT